MDANENRRHDTIGERAIAGAKLANLKLGSNQHKKEGSYMQEGSLPTVREAADLVGVSHGSISMGKTILASGNEEVIEKVQAGEMSLRAAIKVVKPQVEEESILDEPEPSPKPKPIIIDGKTLSKNAPVSFAINASRKRG